MQLKEVVEMKKKGQKVVWVHAPDHPLNELAEK